jgi:CheY-like chemotaxis protein
MHPTTVLASVKSSFVVAALVFIAMVITNHSLSKSLAIAISLQIVSFLTILLLAYLKAYLQQKELSIPEKTPNNSATVSDVWRFYECKTDSQNSSTAALFASDKVQSRIIGTDLAGIGYDVHHATDADAVLGSIRDNPEKWDLLIFDMDAATSLETAVDDLIDFRKICPDIPVILLTETVERDDFSSHRKLIGDATLAKPVFRSRLLEAMHIVGQDVLLRY